jgi:cytochrome c oxidase cbb3-type subunit 4
MQGVDVDMDINVFRAVILVTLMVSFVGLWIWAWSRKRKPAFHEASMLPLEEDTGVIPTNGKGSESC